MTPLDVSCPFEDERTGAIGKLRHTQHDGRIRELEACVKSLEAWKRLAAHYETDHAADQSCDKDCRGFPHPASECEHLDWGQDEGGEAYCHDCNRIVPMDFVPRRLP